MKPESAFMDWFTSQYGSRTERGDIPPWRCKAAKNLRCMRLGKFRLISRHYMRGLRYWRAAR